MARRYTRSVQIENYSEEEAIPVISELLFELNQIIDSCFDCNHWQVEDDETGSLLGVRFIKSTFHGRLNVTKTVDVINQPGQGAIRKLFLPVNAECANVKRKKGRETENAILHKTMMVFGTVGGILFAVAGAAFEAFLIGMIHLYLVGFLFALGAAIGGGVGAFIGNTIGKKVNSTISQTSEHEESMFQQAMEEWQQFVSAMAEKVDAFAHQVEQTPSAATIM